MTDVVAGTTLLAAEKIPVGEHTEAELFGMTFNVDTIYATLISAAIVLGLAFYLRAKITSGVPSGVQLFFEAITTQVRTQVEGAIGMRVAPFVLPLGVALFIFILFSNWLSVLPAQYGYHEWVKPPASDINFVFALAAFVFVMYQAAGIRRRGPLKHVKQTVKGHIVFMAPLNIIEELAKPVSLSLRLFGNMFAGGIMVTLIGLFPAWILWGPNFIWKTFDLFVGLLQAIIFTLLTIIYFSQSMALEDEHH
jgi:F-type H+-transporting ATPase subunit a